MAVPEAAVYEHRALEGLKNDVRAAWKIRLVQAKSVAHPKQRATHHQLRRRVFATNSRHASRTLLSR